MKDFAPERLHLLEKRVEFLKDVIVQLLERLPDAEDVERLYNAMEQVDPTPEEKERLVKQWTDEHD